MKPNLKKTQKNLARILDSDDELPDSYEETFEIPAYLNDSRFDHIELPWLENCKPVKISKEPQKPQSTQKNIEDTIEEKEDSEIFENSEILISQGVLTTQDLFLVKSIQEYCAESTLLWFIESLKNKTATNNVCRSCLIKDLCHIDNTYEQDYLFDQRPNYYFNLITS